MTDDLARQIAADYIASLTEREHAEFIADARSAQTELREFANKPVRVTPTPPRHESLDFLRRLTGTPAGDADRAKLADHFAAQDHAEAEAEAAKQAEEARRQFVRQLTGRSTTATTQLNLTLGETK